MGKDTGMRGFGATYYVRLWYSRIILDGVKPNLIIPTAQIPIPAALKLQHQNKMARYEQRPQNLELGDGFLFL